MLVVRRWFSPIKNLKGEIVLCCSRLNNNRTEPAVLTVACVLLLGREQGLPELAWVERRSVAGPVKDAVLNQIQDPIHIDSHHVKCLLRTIYQLTVRKQSTGL